jgi:tRNA-(ms[2]io[6]A)-hydroxylase
MKAASNALSLAVRASETPGVVAALVSLAEEELTHFRRVFGELESRGVPLGPPPPDGYAAELRKTVRAHRDPSRAQQTEALVDRLLVAALIEARSCERFRLLSEALRERGPRELAPFYEELLAAEARHFRTFVDLARQVAHPDEAWVDARLGEVARLEGEIASRLEGAPAIHG